MEDCEEVYMEDCEEENCDIYRLTNTLPVNHPFIMLETTPSVTQVQKKEHVMQPHLKTAQIKNCFEDMIIGSSSEGDSDYNPEEQGN